MCFECFWNQNISDCFLKCILFCSVCNIQRRLRRTCTTRQRCGSARTYRSSTAGRHCSRTPSRNIKWYVLAFGVKGALFHHQAWVCYWVCYYKPFRYLPSSDITSGSLYPDVWWIDQPTSWNSPLGRLVDWSSHHSVSHRIRFYLWWYPPRGGGKYFVTNNWTIYTAPLLHFVS